jgi:hypothetical protein
MVNNCSSICLFACHCVVCPSWSTDSDYNNLLYLQTLNLNYTCLINDQKKQKTCQWRFLYFQGVGKDGPFNFHGGGGYVFFLKKYSDSQCCWKKYSDFGGGKKK